MSDESDEDRNWFDVRKQPVQVEATGPYDDPSIVETMEGDYEVDEEYIEEHGGYYLIRGTQDEIYPCGVDVFKETYEVIAQD
jgi:uncharacterized protein YozE (UPF0346 family)